MNVRTLPFALLSLGLNGCYLVASGKIETTCEDLPEGCGGDSADPDGDGVSEADGDCGPDDPDVYPGASDAFGDDIDADCDGVDGVDGDGDGYAGEGGPDCDDANAEVSPGAAEVCDGADLDEDCNGLSEDADPGVNGQQEGYVDADGDGYGSGEVITACDLPTNAVSVGGDCADEDRFVNPGETEVCGDGIDNDCDGFGPCEPMSGEMDPSMADAATFGWSSYFGLHISGVDVNADGRDELITADLYSGAGGGSGSVFILGIGRSEYLSAEDGAMGAVRALPSEATLGYSPMIVDALRGGELGLAVRDGTGTTLIFAVEDLLTAGAGGLVPGDEAARLPPLATWNDVQRSMAGGNFNGDATGDVLVGGSDSYGANDGAVYLFRGPLSGSVSVSTAWGFLGSSTTTEDLGFAVAMGDLDGDGLDEAIMSDPYWDLEGSVTYAGGVAVFRGDTTGGLFDASDADLFVVGTEDYAQVGYALETIDADGDGVEELVVVAASQTGCGVYAPDWGRVMRPSDAAVRISSGDGVNPCLAIVADDFDGDGAKDVAVSSPFDSSLGTYNHGAVSVLYGPLAGGTYRFPGGDAVIRSGYEYTYYGIGLGSADLDGDGAAELMASGYSQSQIDIFFGGSY
jgi:hypothetical protein